jgi:hypothetical protein
LKKDKQKAKSKRSGTILPTTIWTESPAIANSSREFQESYSISKDQVRKNIDDWLNSQPKAPHGGGFNRKKLILFNGAFEFQRSVSCQVAAAQAQWRRSAYCIRIALRDVQCPRCNGYGRPRTIAMARHPSI